jgi:hypothetical protein
VHSVLLLRDGRPEGRSSSPVNVKNFVLCLASRPDMGPTQSPIQWVQEALSPGLQRPERETDHLPPSSVETNKTWIYTSTSHTP